MGLREMRIEVVDLISMVQDSDRLWAFVNTVMNFWVP
jgi:hypothetical protein